MNLDLLLVLGYFRLAASYLSIVRHLSPGMRIGVMPVPTDSSLNEKTGEAGERFVRLCEEFGAEIVPLGTPVQTRLLIVQQFPYGEEQAASINRTVSANRRAGLMALATAGLENHDHFVEQFAVGKVYVPSVRLMKFLLEQRQATDRYARVEIEEVGLPFERYPVFPEFSVDWLIAAPTLFSFSDEAGKQAFLRTVLELLSQIPAGDVVAYKSHNGNALDYFAPRFHYTVATALGVVPRREAVLRALLGAGPKILRRNASKTLTSALYQRVLGRAMALSDMTPYADFSLEAFLPGVRKGVLGGLSNTIWGTLYFRRPFFNCADPSLNRNGPSALLSRNSSTLLDLNLKYFGVPFCGGSLSRGATGEDIVLEEDRQGDLLQAIHRDLKKRM
jgi:hypothetical protein